MPNPINPEDSKEGNKENVESNELAADFIARHPEWVEPAKVETIASPELLELESMISEFESKHSIEELLLITDLSPEDARSHPVREPARLDLIAITEKFKYMKE